MFILERKHINFIIVGFIVTFFTICLFTILITSFLFQNKYNSIYTDDIVTIKSELEQYRQLDSDILNSLEKKYENIIRQKDIQIRTLQAKTNNLESIFYMYKEDKEKDIELILEYTYALDQSKQYHLTYNDIKNIVDGCDAENFNSYAPHMVIALMQVESDFNPRAVSSTDARGIAQFKEKTAKWIYEDHLGYIKYNHKYAFDKSLSIKMCIKYLSILYDQTKGDINKMLLGYNGNDIGDLYYKSINNNMIKNSGYTIYDVYKNIGEGVIY